MGTVYFIGSTSQSDAVKVGYSGNIAARQRSLQTGAAVKLAVLAEIEGDVGDERKLHARYRDFRLSGEWFVRSDIIKADMDAINAGTFDLASVGVDADAMDLARADALVLEGKALRSRVLARLRKRRQRGVSP